MNIFDLETVLGWTEYNIQKTKKWIDMAEKKQNVTLSQLAYMHESLKVLEYLRQLALDRIREYELYRVGSSLGRGKK